MPIDWSDEKFIDGRTKVMRICKDCGDINYIAKTVANDTKRCAPCARKE